MRYLSHLFLFWLLAQPLIRSAGWLVQISEQISLPPRHDFRSPYQKPRVLRKEIREQRAAYKTLGVADRKEAAKLVKGYSAFRPPRCIVGHTTFAVRRPPR